MKANELMVGDYLTFSDVQNDSNCPKLRVVVINEEDVYVSNDGDPIADLCDPKELSGIPITPEILEKNGFIMDEKDGVAVRYSFATDLHKPKQTAIQFAFYGGGVSADTLFKCWTSPKDCDGINDLHICDLKFIHELQHALRLCGIEKEIIL